MNKLAIKSGKPVRIEPLPQEWCGAHFIDEKELAAVSRVIKSRSLFRYYGFDLQNEVSKLEKEFASYIGSKHAIAVSSGTGALQVALGALGVGPGDEIILPGYFWVATVGAVVRSGAIPVLVDSDDTFSLDPSKVEAKITPRTKAIIIVHMGGVIGHIKELVKSPGNIT
jgi:8-amino-3,8-dideoxy-alpha-D-manno-octulosonate transaminase